MDKAKQLGVQEQARRHQGHIAVPYVVADIDRLAHDRVARL
jgi:hypothetical protein